MLVRLCVQLRMLILMVHFARICVEYLRSIHGKLHQLFLDADQRVAIFGVFVERFLEEMHQIDAVRIGILLE